jgi:integrase
MASIHRRPGSKYWHAAWRDAHGRLILRSTKQTEGAKALTFALECERAEKLAGAGALSEAQARKIVSDIMERVGTGEVLRNPSIEGWLREWMEGKEARKSASTAVRYGQIVEEFIAHLADRAKRPLTVLTTRDIQSFLTKRQNAGCSPTTVQLDGKILRTALNQARREGLLSVNPAEAVELPQRQSVERGTFNPTEVKMLVDAAEGDWKTFILLGYFTGARLSDCCRMEWSGVDLAQGTLTYFQHKTRKRITIPLHGDLHAHLEQLASTDAPEKFIMPGMAEKGPGGRHGLSEGFKRIARKAGLDVQTVQGAGMRKISRRTFHALRHSFTSALANAEVAPELRMKLTGHASAAIHRGYTHHELAVLRNAVSKLPSLAAG